MTVELSACGANREYEIYGFGTSTPPLPKRSTESEGDFRLLQPCESLAKPAVIFAWKNENLHDNWWQFFLFFCLRKKNLLEKNENEFETKVSFRKNAPYRANDKHIMIDTGNSYGFVGWLFRMGD